MSEKVQSSLKLVQTGELAPAEIVIGLTTDEIDEAVGLWSPYLKKQIDELGANPDHSHWDWSLKARSIRGLQGYSVVGIRADGDLQGMLLWDDIETRAKHPSQLGRELVYVHYLSTAPWNDAELTDTPKYRGAGSQLLAVSVAHSVEQEFKGRVGLHALSKSENFYREKCRMADLGEDAAHQNLRYFEFTEELATVFLNETGVRL